jgi:hypothetical protein
VAIFLRGLHKLHSKKIAKSAKSTANSQHISRYSNVTKICCGHILDSAHSRHIMVKFYNLRKSDETSIDNIFGLYNIMALPFQPIPPIAPPPVIGQQPDFHNPNQNLQGAFQELALLGNAPGPAIQAQLQHLVNQSNQIINHLQQLTNAVNNVTATYVTLIAGAIIEKLIRIIVG